MRTAEWKFIRHSNGDGQPDRFTAELYRLSEDPLEMRNLVNDPGVAGTRKELERELEKLSRQAGRDEMPVYEGIVPSHNMVIYAIVAGGVSVGKLFLAGYIPGIMVGMGLMVSCYIIAIRRNYPREERPPFRHSLVIFRDGLLAVVAALVIVAGIAFGVFTVSEASAIAVFYALFLGLFVYREMRLIDAWPVLVDSVKTTTSVLFLSGCSTAFAWMMTFLQVPAKVTAFFLSLTADKYILYFLINILLLVLGMIMDVAPLIVIVTPVLLPVVQSTGMDPVTFGVLLMVNLGIGL